MRINTNTQQCLNGSVKKVKGSVLDKSVRIEMDSPVFRKLQEAIVYPCRSCEWFALAEQAINTVYALGDQPRNPHNHPTHTAARCTHLTASGPPPKPLSTFQPPEVRSHAATIHGGNWCLREAAHSVGAGMSVLGEHNRRPGPDSPGPTRPYISPYHCLTYSQPALVHRFYHTCLSILCISM